MLGSALTLMSLLLPAIASAQGLRSGGSVVTLLVTKPPPTRIATRDLEFPLTWSNAPSHVTVRVSGERTGGAALFVRDRRGRLERAGGDAIEVHPALLSVRVVEAGGGPLPPGRWHLVVRAEGQASGTVEVAHHIVEIR